MNARLPRGLASPRSQRFVLAGLAALALAAGIDGVQLLRQQRWNAAIVAATAASDMPAAAPAAGASEAASAASAGATTWDDATVAAVPELAFALAHVLAARGMTDAALQRYGRLVADPAVGVAARFNSANLLLRQGMALRAGEQPGQALALIELAKERYRELLRQDPEHWPARYNLERAQRLVPDPEPGDEEPGVAPRAAERAATTMRAYSPGLP